ncbi:uncharacterized protein BP5553_09290 [Venustampulla echinocandica]|uniref:Diaminopimelate epimerase-like protein n=1 Tax=Venustampulla echinocandica TaxID=2656787 RepID=A0A370TCB0_9HELO|nr:uncharacterized protein BP5553_09290 [Venustampulla echinocandica]RDL31888.1 hypothetical protein BP5553_09290 [Venustampulla echinocandica]
MKLNFTTLDVFTTARYKGNPLSIISVPSSLKPSLTQTQKQAIAQEFNLSEIVFLHLPPPDADSNANAEREIDIFTSHAEVPFAGHPTVGTSYYLLRNLSGDGKNVKTLITKAGRIPISLSEADGTKVQALVPFDFHIHALKFSTPSTLEGTNKNNPVVSIVNGMSFVLVSLPSLSALENALKSGNLTGKDTTYDPSALDEGWRNGLIGTMYFVSVGEENGERRYRTRMFASREDPGTGSASSGLACFLALESAKARGVGQRTTERFVFEQGVEMGRRNEITVEVEVDGGEVKKVLLSGAAVQVMEGSLEV